MIKIDVTITLRTPMNIGSGAQQGTLAQRGMLKERDGWPYIPATLLKGRLRHYAEQVASTLPNTTVRNPHDLTNIEADDLVSQVFGTPWQQGRVFFEDCYLSGPPAILEWRRQMPNPRTMQRTGVSINRRRKVAADQRLYKTELLLPGVPLSFSGTIRGHLNRKQAALLVAGLNLVPAFGRGKSGGLGWIEVETHVQNGDEIWSDENLLTALQGDAT